MRLRTLRVTIPVLGAAIALAMTGCSAGTTASPAATTTNQTALQKKVAAAGYTKLTAATDVTIGLPWAAAGDSGAVAKGLDADLITALGKELGVPVTTANTGFDTLIPGLAAKRYDFSVSAMLDSELREKQVDFVDFITDASGFLVKKGSTSSNLALADTCGMSIGAVKGSVEQIYLTDQSKKCTAAGKKAVDLQIFDQLQAGVLAVTAGRIDAMCGDQIQNLYLQVQPNAQVAASGAGIGVAPVGMAIQKDSKLVPLLQTALQQLMDDGSYTKILTKWGLEKSAVSSATINKAVS